MPKISTLSQIPEHFKKLIEVYGFADEKLLSKVVAVRSAEAWYAILFQDDDNLFAVDFKFYGGDDSDILGGARRNGWEIQNDEVGPFESINEFLNTKLTHSFF